jgi:gliding motility associated protien GldN
MRRISVLFAICSLLIINNFASAQSSLRLDEDSILFNISTDVQQDLRDLWPTPQNVKWSRQVYREVFFKDLVLPSATDTTKTTVSLVPNRANSLLKFPEEPISSYVNEGGISKLITKQNFFWLLFKLVTSHKVPVYKSNDYLTFTENNLMKSDTAILSSLKYTRESKGKYVIKDNYTQDLNDNIIGYLIKENYYFDAEVSELRSQVIAIAPLIDNTTMGGARDFTIPFWITYESIVPWLMNYTMMISETNNSDLISFDTYFKKRMFKGSIMKIENPLNYTLAKECSECCPDDIQNCIKRKQAEVENQIIDFDQKQLWAKPVVIPMKKGKASKSAVSSSKDQQKKEPTKKVVPKKKTRKTINYVEPEPVPEDAVQPATSTPEVVVPPTVVPEPKKSTKATKPAKVKKQAAEPIVAEPVKSEVISEAAVVSPVKAPVQVVAAPVVETIAAPTQAQVVEEPIAEKPKVQKKSSKKRKVIAYTEPEPTKEDSIQ